jgi:NADH:ubiquinone oxidoreductase subunit 2 (subunit N)
MAKEGSTLAGLMDSFAIVTSIALQYGVPVKVLVDKFIHTRFEPSGYTDNPKIRFASSVVDYVFKWLALRFLPESDLKEFHPLLLAMVTGMVGVVFAGDLFTFFIFWEMMSIASYLLVAFRYRAWEAVEASFKYLIMSAAGAATTDASKT